MIGCPLRWIGEVPEARSTAPVAPASITAWVGRIPGPSSTRSQVPLPSRICSARKSRADFSFPPSYTLSWIAIAIAPARSRV